MEKLFTKQNRGFTLVETLVAIAIFTLSILGLMSVLASGITDTNYAKQKMTASYLAQEGIEYIRNMRDTFVLYDATSAQAGWDAFNTKLINSSCNPNTGCYFDNQNLNYTNHLQPMAGLTVTACGVSCPSLLYDTTTGKYGYASGVNSGFVRKIRVNQISANEMQIISNVSWTQGSGVYKIILSENLFNWAE